MENGTLSDHIRCERKKRRVGERKNIRLAMPQIVVSSPIPEQTGLELTEVHTDKDPDKED